MKTTLLIKWIYKNLLKKVMLKGNVGGQFASQQIRTVDQDIEYPNLEVGPTQNDFIPQVQPSQNEDVESPFWPQSGYSHPPLQSETRVRHGLGMSPDLDLSLPFKLPNPAPLREQWLKYKAVNITPILPDEMASEVHQYYFNQPRSYWEFPIHPDPYFDYAQNAIENPDYYHMYDAKEGDPTIPERIAHAHSVNNMGDFSYMYYRASIQTQRKHQYLDLFSSQPFKDYLSTITGHENLHYEDDWTFVNCYESGHYNGPHTDGNNGRIAFVYHLSKDWKPEMGGLFMRMDWDWKTVNKVVTPPFNTLTIFDTEWDGQRGAPHMVSEVAQGCDNKRISYTGWYL